MIKIGVALGLKTEALREWCEKKLGEEKEERQIQEEKSARQEELAEKRR